MKALVLAGGFPQIALIQELKKRGITVLLADYNENPVARPYADQFFQASTLDVEAITEIARREAVDFVITVCTDQALLTVAKVSETLGLPCYIDYQTALNVTNKSYMKQVFVAHGIPTARHVVMGELDWKTIQGMEYPLIVKPVDCNSSKGVKKVTNDEELQAAFADAVSFSRTDTALVEDFIEGMELTVDVYVEEGKAHVLSLSNNDKIGEADKFVIFRTRYPAVWTETILPLVQETAQKIADAFGLKNCPMLIQMISDGKRVFVLEFSARTGGGVKHLLIRRVSGFDVIGAVVDLTLGKKPHLEPGKPENRYIVNEFIYCRPGIFDRLAGFEELKSQGILSDYYLFKWQGAEFKTIASSGDRVAGFTIQADTLEDLRQKHETAVSGLQVLDIQGSDMMRHDLLVDVAQYYE